MSIGENIKLHRTNLNLTQKQLAEKAGISESAIKYYESNRRNAKIKTLIKIAEALSVDLSTLLQGTDYTELTSLNKDDQDLYDENYKKYINAFKEFGYSVINHSGTYFSGAPKTGFIYDVLDENKNLVITLSLDGFCKFGKRLFELSSYKQTFDKSLKILISSELDNLKFIYEISENEEDQEK